MVSPLSNRRPVAWPQIQQQFAKEPEFDAKKSAQHEVDLSNALHAVASQTRREYTDALAMFCAGQPDFAHGYLLRAEYVYKTYGKQEYYDRGPDHVPFAGIYRRGQTNTFAAWNELALHDRWLAELLQSGLQDLYNYLTVQTYDDTRAYSHEDEDRLFTVLCQMALGEFEIAAEWLKTYVSHRKAKKLEESFSELMAGIEAQLERGPGAIAEPFRTYFNHNRLGNYKFAETQSFWICVPMAVLMERNARDWEGSPTWNGVLEYLLY